jgi:hypothetical protein
MVTCPLIVPQELRWRVGWTESHDALALLLMAEYNLKLPRDRELIRQLTLSTSTTGGKLGYNRKP